MDIEAESARQGAIRHGVRYVLAFGLLLAVIAAAVFLLFYW
jgi:hypothetical protein